MEPSAGDPAPSARQQQLLEQAYAYVLTEGLTGLSLRPLAAAIGSSPRVLLYLFGSKDGLIRALLARAREDELGALRQLTAGNEAASPAEVGRVVWAWLSDPAHRGLLTLWLEGYSRSLSGDAGPWAEFGASTVRDWLAVLAEHQPAAWRQNRAGQDERTALLAVLRGALLDLLATGDRQRTTRAVEGYLAGMAPVRSSS